MPTTDASAREFASKIFAAGVSLNPKICGIIQELAAKTESIFPWVSKEMTGCAPNR
jgi:hypothetical protein